MLEQHGQLWYERTFGDAPQGADAAAVYDMPPPRREFTREEVLTMTAAEMGLA